MIKVRNIAIITSGGDASGMNACVRAITRAAIYHNIGAFGFLDGFQGLIENRYRKLAYHDVSNILQRGGTILGTARSADFLEREMREKAYENLIALQIDALVVIGGDGSFKGATVFGNEFDLAVIGVPATIDNDINGTEYTIGFDTALNNVIHAIDQIRDTASSHHRVFLVEVMGRNSGMLALYSAAASGAEEVFLPETKEDLSLFERKIVRALSAKKSSIIIVAEGDEMGGAKEVYQYLKERRLHDRVRVSVLGHMQRGGSPSFKDRLCAALMGEQAIVQLLKGKRNELIGWADDRIAVLPLSVSQEAGDKPKLDYLKLIRKLSVY